MYDLAAVVLLLKTDLETQKISEISVIKWKAEVMLRSAPGHFPTCTDFPTGAPLQHMNKLL